MGSRVGGGWVGLGLLWDFFCAKNTLSILFLCYILSNFFMNHFYVHILIVSCLRATGFHNSWAPVKFVFVSVGAHSFMVSFFFFIFRGSFIAGLLFPLAFGGHLLPCDS